jgi:hypothetical protein
VHNRPSSLAPCVGQIQTFQGGSMDNEKKFSFTTIETTDKSIRRGTKYGSTSITLSIITILSGIILLLVAQYESLRLPWSIMYSIVRYIEIIQYVAIALNCITPIINIIGITFGVIAIIKKEPKIYKPIIGIILNAFLLLLTSCPIVLYLILLLMPRS